MKLPKAVVYQTPVLFRFNKAHKPL